MNMVEVTYDLNKGTATENVVEFKEDNNMTNATDNTNNATNIVTDNTNNNDTVNSTSMEDNAMMNNENMNNEIAMDEIQDDVVVMDTNNEMENEVDNQNADDTEEMEEMEEDDAPIEIEGNVLQFDKSVLPWTVKTLVNQIDRGKATFDNAVQRSLVWNNDRKSMLIHSLIINAPIPPMYAVKDEDGIYDFIDGKQRSNAIYQFIKGEYKLTNVPEVEFDSDILLDINGLNYERLPEQVKDVILSYSLSINWFDGISDDDVADLFYRLNSGVTLSAIELSRVKCPCLETVQELGRHELFKKALSEKAFAKYTNEDLVIKSSIMLFTEEPCLDTKFVRPYTTDLVLTEEQELKMTRIYDKIMDVYNILTSIDDKDVKKKAKRMLVRTHLISLIPTFEMAIENENEWDDYKLAAFILKFFTGNKGVSCTKKYNDYCGSGVGHKENVAKRLDAIKGVLEKFVSEYDASMWEVEDDSDNVSDSNTESEIVDENVEAA